MSFAALTRRIKEARNADPAEFEQERLRIVMFWLFALYLVVWFLRDGTISDHELGTIVIAQIVFAWIVAHTTWMLLRPGPNDIRRYAGAVVDMANISVFMSREEDAFSALFGLYLWIVLGNGLRFGVRYLYFSQVLAIASFIVVWASTDFWRRNPTISVGLVAVLIVVPLYASILISRLHAASRRLETARHEAETANLSKSRFLAAASHDLRQPMQALSMYASVLEQRAADADAKRVVQGVQLSVRTLEQLFDSLLDVSKIETGVIQPSVVPFPLMPLIERVVEAQRPLAVQKELELRVARTCAVVRTDPVLLERILTNLVTNAIRYTERGGILVGCRWLPHQRLRLSVADTGVGIALNEQARIFDEYYQIDGKSAQGLGLGLTIVKALSALLGHAVEVRSAPGRGSTFSVSLMRIREPLAATEAPEAPRVDLGGACVVVLDDDAEIRRSMDVLLSTWGCRCVSGATLAEIQEKLRAQSAPPEALIVDYRLAEALTGVQAIERLRAEFGAQIPALVITGTHHSALPDARGIPFLAKPTPPGKLRAFLSQAVRRAADTA